MKRFVVSLISSILAFTAGLVTASSWSSKRAIGPLEEQMLYSVRQPCTPTTSQPAAPVQSFTVTPPQEFGFGQNGLKLVPEQVRLKSESAGYDIDVSYPQIFDMTDTKTANVRKVNQHIKGAATKLYQWPLNPAAAGRRPFQARAGIRDTVSFTYHVGLATDSFLSVEFIGYSYDGSASRHVQDSFTLNYDLASGQQLKLSDIFKPRSNYLEVISSYCQNELSKDTPRALNNEALAPSAKNFEHWQITSNGILLSFQGCKVASCSDGDLIVQIPFSRLESVLNAGVPGKFEITYP
jgi:hypothetical protein